MGCFMKPSIRVMTSEDVKILKQEEGYARVLVEYHNDFSAFSMLAGPAFEDFAAQSQEPDLLCVRVPVRVVIPQFVLLDLTSTACIVDEALKATDEASGSSVSTCAPEAFQAVEKAMECFNGHNLQPFTTPRNRYFCDVCGKTVKEGTTMNSCRICNFDCCVSCDPEACKQKKFLGGSPLETPWFITVERLQEILPARRTTVQAQQFQPCKLGLAVSQVVMGPSGG